ncbi:MAG: DUF4376 domain-containing protein [Nitrospinae bacterium]|nr:DUF4376 domain-containing protein [Nitrospinota bacterium]
MVIVQKLVAFLRPGAPLNLQKVADSVAAEADTGASAMQAAIDAAVISWNNAVPVTGEEAIAAIPAFWAAEEAKAQAARAESIAAKRYTIEVSGIVVNGMNIPSDRDTQMKMMAARIRAKEDANYFVQWKTPGGFVTLNAPSVIAIADALADHVQACFNREAALLADPSLDINTGWPGQAA